MTDWYVAPDNTTVSGVTLATIGSTNYATGSTPAVGFSRAAKWSEFKIGSGSVWTSKFSDGDRIIFLGAAYNLGDISGGWAQLNNAYTSLSFLGMNVDGKAVPVVFYGSRSWPWPADGDHGGATIGESFMRLTTGHGTTNFNNLHFRNIGFPINPNSNGTTPDLGTINMTDCSSINAAGAFGYTSNRSDGRLNVNLVRTVAHGYSRGCTRVWGSITAEDVVCDSEFQSTAKNQSNNPQSTAGLNSKDAIPGFTASTTPMTVKKFIGRNHAAGASGGGYPQGDAIVAEENVGMFTGSTILTYNNGDRGIDLKCTGNAQFVTSLGDGTAGVSHHMDTLFYQGWQHLLKVGTRPTGVTNPSVCAQTSGKLRLIQSALICRPTAAQAANNPTAISTGSVDPPKIGAGGGYGGMHQGIMELIDCFMVLATSVGATEQNAYNGASDQARLANIFGLTAGTTRNFAIRAHAQDGSSSALSPTIPFTLDSNTGGDVTGLAAAPTGFAITAKTSSTMTFTWNQVASDAGTEVQGYVLKMSTDGGTTYVPVCPAKTNAPLTVSGLKPATTYYWKLAAYDATDNIGTFTSAVFDVTSAGSTDTNTPGPVGPLSGNSGGKLNSSGGTIGSSTIVTASALARVGPYTIDLGNGQEEAVIVTALSGSNNTTATLAAPLTKTHAASAALAGWVPTTYVERPTTAAMNWSLPTTGTVAYYEVVDPAAPTVVLARCLPIPVTGTTPVYTKSNARLSTV